MKTAISLPDTLFADVDLLAQELGISRSEVFVRAVRAYLDQRRSARLTEKVNEILEDEDPTLDRVLHRMQLTSIQEEAW